MLTHTDTKHTTGREILTHKKPGQSCLPGALSPKKIEEDINHYLNNKTKLFEREII